MQRYMKLLVPVVILALVPRHEVLAQTVWSNSGTTGYTTGASIIGITNFRCDCTLSGGSRNEPVRFQFRSEPMILGIYSGSPADGLLERGDYITQVDGRSILTPEGAKRLANVGPGDDVNLTIRRDGSTMKVSIHTPDTPSRTYVYSPRGSTSSYSSVWEVPTPVVAPAMPSTPAPVAAPAPRAIATPAPPAIASGVYVAAPTVPPVPPVPPTGWFGFSIRCTDCGWSRSTPSERATWEFDEAPELAMVSRASPAGRAGLQAGDRITHIDGISITSKEGGRRFGAVESGQKVKLTIKRGTSTFTRELTLGERPETRAAIAAYTPKPPTPAVAPSLRRELRYTGKLDNVSVEVWSAGGPTIDRTGDTITITLGASVVRLKVDPDRTP